MSVLGYWRAPLQFFDLRGLLEQHRAYASSTNLHFSYLSFSPHFVLIDTQHRRRLSVALDLRFSSRAVEVAWLIRVAP